MTDQPEEETPIPPTIYANNVRIYLSFFDVVLNFSEQIPLRRDADGDIVVAERPIARLALTPQHAKVLSVQLASQVERWESTFGEIPDKIVNQMVVEGDGEVPSAGGAPDQPKKKKKKKKKAD